MQDLTYAADEMSMITTQEWTLEEMVID